MQESTLTKFCLSIAILGILILYFISRSQQPEPVLLSQLSQEFLDKEIRTQGVLTKIDQTPGLYILTLTQNSRSIQVIVFKENTPLDGEIKGGSIEVTGVFSQYEGQFEILAKEVKDV